MAIPPTKFLTPDLVPGARSIRIIAGFWRRLVALGIDSLLVGAVGVLLGMFLSVFFQRLGSWGPLLGFAIALPYAGFLNSSIGNGQTLGKRLMQIRVVDRNGQFISPRVSFARYAIFAAPWFLSTNMLPALLRESWIGSEVGVFLSGVQVAIAYLYIFNRQTRQSLHDLVMGTYVVESVITGGVDAPPVWKGHIYVAVALVPTLLVSVPLAVPRIMHWRPFPEVTSVLQAVEKLDNVGAADVSLYTSVGTDKTTTLTVTVSWRHQPQNEEMEATKVAAQVLATDPKASSSNSLLIRTANGYDIGIARSWRYGNFAYTPEQWRDKIRAASATQGAVAQ